jgi:hypothetical protein
MRKERKARASFFEKKGWPPAKAKKLLLFGFRAVSRPRPNLKKFFAAERFAAI